MTETSSSRKKAPRARDFVVAATVAAHIHAATKHAQQMALVAKNARAIAVRAGDEAMGFRPITDFIEELASRTSRSAEEVRRLSVEIARIAVDRAREESFSERLAAARARTEGGTLGAHLEGCAVGSRAELQRLASEAHGRLRTLRSSLEDGIREIRAATAIASASRVEASRTAAARDQLERVAAAIDASATSIREHLVRASKQLDLVGGDAT